MKTSDFVVFDSRIIMTRVLSGVGEV